jgi:hypothetical protein
MNNSFDLINEDRKRDDPKNQDLGTTCFLITISQILIGMSSNQLRSFPVVATSLARV